jgi:hypothetical protein
MKPLNKFRLLTNAPFYMLVQDQGNSHISTITIQDFFNLNSEKVLNGTAHFNFSDQAFIPIGGLN